jgi:hypothetical protein
VSSNAFAAAMSVPVDERRRLIWSGKSSVAQPFDAVDGLCVRANGQTMFEFIGITIGRLKQIVDTDEQLWNS